MKQTAHDRSKRAMNRGLHQLFQDWRRAHPTSCSHCALHCACRMDLGLMGESGDGPGKGGKGSIPGDTPCISARAHVPGRCITRPIQLLVGKLFPVMVLDSSNHERLDEDEERRIQRGRRRKKKKKKKKRDGEQQEPIMIGFHTLHRHLLTILPVRCNM